MNIGTLNWERGTDNIAIDVIAIGNLNLFSFFSFSKENHQIRANRDYEIC